MLTKLDDLCGRILPCMTWSEGLLLIAGVILLYVLVSLIGEWIWKRM